jgi:hypothetical protein
MKAANHPLRGLSFREEDCLAKPCDAAGESMQKTLRKRCIPVPGMHRSSGPWSKFQAPVGESQTQCLMRPGTGRATVSLQPCDDRCERLRHKLWHKSTGPPAASWRNPGGVPVAVHGAASEAGSQPPVKRY